jgi:SAM-dependent methyltransferase
MNYFSPRTAAERYHKGRPYFHPLLAKRIQQYLSHPVRRAVDVGCGTGLSTRALTTLASTVIGCDVSSEMLSFAPNDPSTHYCAAAAEQMPFATMAFDLLTISSVFHWLKRDAFLAEARRVLAPQGWLIIYDNYFTGQTEKSPEFSSWFRERYTQRYPSPPRNRAPFEDEDAQAAGFIFLHREQYENTVHFSVPQLADYLTTQSNIIAAVEGGAETVDEVWQWLTTNLLPFFASAELPFRFGGPIWYLQKR